MNLKFYIISLFLLFAYVAQGQHSNPDKHLEGCLGMIEGQTVSGKTGCYQIAAEQWEAEVDNTINLLYTVLDAHQHAVLKHEHSAWLKYKEEYFKLVIEIFGRKDLSNGELFIAEEKYEFFKTRALQLRDHHERYTRLFWTRKN